MWPDDFIDWSWRLHRQTYRVAAQALIWRNNDPAFQADIPGLAGEARRATFELARQHQALVGYFGDFNAFRFWIMAVVAQQVTRLYLLHPATQQRLNQLPLLERQLLGLVYVDRLMPSEVAHLLGIPVIDVPARARQAFGQV
jgi:DNA-directed RNA polymerase specialized sigma24 family protein